MRRRRLRTWAKWTCTLAAGAAVTLAVVSRFYGVRHVTKSNFDETVRIAALGTGLMWVHHIDGWRLLSTQPASGWSIVPVRHWYWGYAGEKSPYRDTWTWHAGVLYGTDPGEWGVGVSLLYPVALTLIPAALLWYADRRRRGPGLCKSCGYDRRGLAADAKCPECGTVPAPASK